MIKSELEHTAQQFIAAANRFDTQAVLDLFASDAVIEDVSVGEKFEHTAGIKKILRDFFRRLSYIDKVIVTGIFRH